MTGFVLATLLASSAPGLADSATEAPADRGLPAAPSAEATRDSTLCTTLCAQPRLTSHKESRPALETVDAAGLGFALGAWGGLWQVAGAGAAEGARLEAFGWKDAAVLGPVAGGFISKGLLHRREPALGRGRMGCKDVDSGPCGIDKGVTRALAGRWLDASDTRRRNYFDSVSYATLAATLGQSLGMTLGDGRPGRKEVLLVPVEAGVLALGLTDVVKHVFHRPRPYAHSCEPPAPDALAKPDAQLSFFSGHTAAAFALAVANGRVASELGFRDAGAVKWTGLALAASTGVLRIAAGRHYLSDVLAGAAVGVGAALAVGKLHERREDGSATGAAPRAAGVQLTLPLGGATLVNGRLGPGFALSLSRHW